MEALIPLAILVLAIWLLVRKRGSGRPAGRSATRSARQRTKANEPPPERAAPAVTASQLTGKGEHPITVAGLHHHAAAASAAFSRQIKRLAAEELSDNPDTNLEGITAEFECTVELWPTSNNEHDPLAVEVRVGKHRIGFLPKGLTEAFRDHIKRERLTGDHFRCKAEVSCDIGTKEIEHVSLDLPRLLPK